MTKEESRWDEPLGPMSVAEPHIKSRPVQNQHLYCVPDRAGPNAREVKEVEVYKIWQMNVIRLSEAKRALW